MVHEGIKNLPARRLCAFLAVGVADVLELAVFILEFEVVPVLAAHEYAGIAVLQLQVMDALEDLREGLTALEVQVAIVRSLRKPLAAVVDADQVLVRLGCRPASTNGQRRIELAFDFTDVETDAECRASERRSEADGQRQFCPTPKQMCRCHRRYSMFFIFMAVSPSKNGAMEYMLNCTSPRS